MDLATIRSTSIDPTFQARCLGAALVIANGLLADAGYSGGAARAVATNQVPGLNLAGLVCSDAATDNTATDGALSARVLAIWPCLERAC